MRASEALDVFLERATGKCLDIGAGAGDHAIELRKAGLKVETLDISGDQTHLCDYMAFPSRRKFDAIWCSHVLEHQVNPNLFLEKIHSNLREGGIFAITVPPLKHSIVGGHVTLWNAGLLCYNLILAGFDLSDADVWSYGYNISVISSKKAVELPELNHDSGDVDRLSQYFPVKVVEGFNGLIYEHRQSSSD